MKSLCRKLAFALKQLVKMTMQGVILPAIYWLYSRSPIDEDLVIFADAHKSKLPYSMEEVYKRLQGSSYNIVCFFHDSKEEGYLKTLRWYLSFMKKYARARYVFISDNFLPVSSCNKRKETTVVQLWHAGGILKKYAYDTKDDIPSYYKGNVFKNYSLISVSAPCCIPVYERAMRQDKGVVKALGISRTDRFFSDEYKRSCREAFYKLHPEAMGKKVLLWAPTFRGKASNPYLIGEEAIERLENELSEEWYIITKVHPHMNNKLSLRDGVLTTEELLPLVDMLITDYSSVLFDYVLLERPLVLYAPDLQEYMGKRGFYIDYQELPGAIVTQGEKLKEAILYENENFSLHKLRAFKDKYMSACDGTATDRILKEIGIKG